MKDLMSLKSGTDIRGIASDIFSKKIELDNETITAISTAFVEFLSKNLDRKTTELCLAVGRDSRITGKDIKEQVIKAFTATGAKVFDCDLCTTPAMFMATKDLGANGSVEITASHHPADRNGLKFFTGSGGLTSADIKEVIEIANKIINNVKTKDLIRGTVTKVDYLTTYSKKLRAMICDALGKPEQDKPLLGYHIVVDAGNGVGGFYADMVLKPLGANTQGSVLLEPDGLFPGHIPNPEDRVAMASISRAVLESKADLGLIFDTDVDRAACVNKKGVEINRNRLIALSAAILLKDQPGATVVTDSVTSQGVKNFIEQTLGGKHYRYIRGYNNVISKAKELCDLGENCLLAIETSGHAALRENYFLDDGAYLMTKVVITFALQQRMGKDLEDLIKDLSIAQDEIELRFPILDDDFKAAGLRVLKRLEDFAEKSHDMEIADDNMEGLRVTTADGWFLLRLSVHDPIMPFNVESDTKGGATEILLMLKKFFSTCDELDKTPIEMYLKQT